MIAGKNTLDIYEFEEISIYKHKDEIHCFSTNHSAKMRFSYLSFFIVQRKYFCSANLAPGSTNQSIPVIKGPNDGKEMPEEILTPQAERFRMKLIKDFRLLENLNEMEQGVESPKYFPSDIVNRASY